MDLRKRKLLYVGIIIYLFLLGGCTKGINEEDLYTEEIKNSNGNLEEAQELEIIYHSDKVSLDVFSGLIQINKLSDITDDIIKNGTVETRWKNYTSSKEDTKYLLEFDGFTGMNRYLDLNVTADCEIKISNETNLSNDNFRVVILSANTEIQELTLNKTENIELSKGSNQLILCGYEAKGNLEINLQQ